MPEVLAEDGQVLLRIDIEFDIPWSEELSRVSAYDGDITITLPNGESRRSIGFFYYEGQFRRSSVSTPPAANRRATWPSGRTHLRRKRRRRRQRPPPVVAKCLQSSI